MIRAPRQACPSVAASMSGASGVGTGGRYEAARASVCIRYSIRLSGSHEPGVGEGWSSKDLLTHSQWALDRHPSREIAVKQRFQAGEWAVWGPESGVQMEICFDSLIPSTARSHQSSDGPGVLPLGYASGLFVSRATVLTTGERHAFQKRGISDTVHHPERITRRLAKIHNDSLAPATTPPGDQPP
jgi:hypothetical protein